MNDELFQKIASQVEQEYVMGGLSDGLYFDYAKDCTRRYIEALELLDKDES
jgi:hypothetical protein